jgi:hypothetical protein
MTPEQIQEIQNLRALNLAPKQIARKLGLRPGDVSAVIQASATEAVSSQSARDKSPLLLHCLINENAARRLFDRPASKRKRQHDPDEPFVDNDPISGLAQVVVTRVERHYYVLTSYLVDYWCLGVKDALGPRKVNQSEYKAMIQKMYSRFEQPYREISLEQAQAVVYGAINYADSLGFKPHRDFKRAQANLGEPLEDLPQLEFGRDGKPYFIAGPYDNANRIIAQLRSKVGEGNFHFMAPMSF